MQYFIFTQCLVLFQTIDLRRTSMKFLKRKASLALITLLVGLMVLPGFLNLNTKKVEASTQLQSSSPAPLKKNDVKIRKLTPNYVGGVAPANDNCANAINVTQANLPYTNTQTTNGATNEPGEPASTCVTQGSSVWYTFTNTSASAFSIDVSLCASDFDTAIQVYKVNGTACDFANFAVVACNDDFCGIDRLLSTVSFFAAPNSTYKLQVGGFDLGTGSLGIKITGLEIFCPIVTVDGTLGSGSPDRPSTSGVQTPGRIFRDGVPNTCAMLKTCPDIFDSGSFNYDAYTFPNLSGQSQCVTINYDPNTGANPGTTNLHAVAYLNSYVDTNLCTNYLGDVGSSEPLSFSVTVPAGSTLIIVIVANTPGIGIGQTYKFSVIGNLCASLDFRIQQDAPKRFLEINSTTGAYRYTDCSKNLVRTGTGSAFGYFCKVDFSGSGANSSASAFFNPCTRKGDATIVVPLGSVTQVVKISDKDITNNDCKCPTPPPQ
jgi:hypothetical protein